MVGTHLLPPNLLKLFAPRAPLPYCKPLGRDPDVSIHKKHITCVSPLLDQLKLDAATINEDETLTDSMQVQFERRQEDRIKRKEEKASRQETCGYDPKEDPNATGDPYRTLFISRLSFEATESDLKKEFDMYGPIEKLLIVKNKLTGKSRGYAFILFEREKDMKAAYKDAEGLKIKGRRILVDVERGRTVKGWKPRRLGGGLGG
ncbi:uncharacterized protein MELLADRAFT_35320, partial [Melampsora larici-populina 98AG31]